MQSPLFIQQNFMGKRYIILETQGIYATFWTKLEKATLILQQGTACKPVK